MLHDLVGERLASAHCENVGAGRRTIFVTRLRITDAGRRALARYATLEAAWSAGVRYDWCVRRTALRIPVMAVVLVDFPALSPPPSY